MGTSWPVSCRKNGSIYIPYRVVDVPETNCTLTWERNDYTTNILIEWGGERTIEIGASGAIVWCSSLTKRLGITQTRTYDVDVYKSGLIARFPNESNF